MTINPFVLVDKAGGVVTNIPEENRISVEKGDHMGW